MQVVRLVRLAQVATAYTRSCSPDWYVDHVPVNVEPGRIDVVNIGPAMAWQSWWRKQAAALGLPAAGQGLVLRSNQLSALGVSRQTARTQVRRGQWTRAGYGCLSPLDVRDDDVYVLARRRHVTACAAAALQRPGHFVSGRSAAVLHGLPTFDIPSRPELTAPKSVGLGRRGSGHIHRAGLQTGEVTRWFGIWVTNIARTLVDLGRHDRRDAIMAADAALLERLVTVADIAVALREARGWPGIRQARRVLALADPKAESPLESLARLALHDDGFPPPELQVPIPGTRFRVDMLLREAGLILEIDGLRKYTDAEWRREKRREQVLRRLGYRVERLTWDDVVRDWPRTREVLRAALGLPA